MLLIANTFDCHSTFMMAQCSRSHQKELIIFFPLIPIFWFSEVNKTLERCDTIKYQIYKDFLSYFLRIYSVIKRKFIIHVHDYFDSKNMQFNLFSLSSYTNLHFVELGIIFCKINNNTAPRLSNSFISIFLSSRYSTSAFANMSAKQPSMSIPELIPPSPSGFTKVVKQKKICIIPPLV